MWRAVALLLVLAPSAAANTVYTGTSVISTRHGTLPTSVVLEDSGAARFVSQVGIACHGISYGDQVLDGAGRWTGTRVTGAGRHRVRRGVLLTFRLTATVRNGVLRGRVVGNVRRTSRCRHIHFAIGFTAVADPPPSGPPRRPARSAMLVGRSSMLHGDLPFAVAVKIAPHGRAATSAWALDVKCATGHTSFVNRSPYAPIRANGTFTRRERFTLRYTDGSRDHFRTTFHGRLLADGAVGWLRLQIRSTNRQGRLFNKCDTGKQLWWAKRP